MQQKQQDDIHAKEYDKHQDRLKTTSGRIATQGGILLSMIEIKNF